MEVLVFYTFLILVARCANTANTPNALEASAKQDDVIQRLQQQMRNLEGRQDAQLTHLKQLVENLNRQLADQASEIAQLKVEMKKTEESAAEERGQFTERISDLKKSFAEQINRICVQQTVQLKKTCAQQLDDQHERQELRPDGVENENVTSALSQPQRRADDLGILEPVVTHLTQQLSAVIADIQALKTSNQLLQEAKGTTYVRWGHSACPGNSELVYTGILSGAHNNDTGSGGNHLCLTSHPVFDGHPQPSGNGYSTIYGSEYQNCPEIGCDTTPACAVCRISRSSLVVIPGTNACTSGWTTEYSGYIMANNPLHIGTSEYICVDSAHVPYGGSPQVDENENVIVYTHVKCGSLPCPPFQQESILLCAVCST